MKHAVKHLQFPEVAVETVAEFRQVTEQMFGTDGEYGYSLWSYRMSQRAIHCRTKVGLKLFLTARPDKLPMGWVFL
jgi:hypothetical protein